MDRDSNGNGKKPTISGWTILSGLGAAAAAAGAIYYLSKDSKPQPTESHHREPPEQREPPPPAPESRRASSSNASSYIADLISRVSHNDDYVIEHQGPAGGRTRKTPTNNPIITNMNSLLSDIYVRYVAIKQEDFSQHYDVFNHIFYHLHQKMKDVDKYYERYSSTVQFAGSHYDRLRIKKPDEFDMDVVIGMPLSIKTDYLSSENSDFTIEPKEAGFVNLKMGPQYQNLPMRDSQDWAINKTAYTWKDSDNYLLRSKFIDWFKSVVTRALNQFNRNGCYHVYNINGTEYTIERSESGPAVTLIIKNKHKRFQLDVDLVPALKFPEERWPPRSDYRRIPAQCRKDFWMVVPKPNKSDSSDERQSRAWRIALHYQERELMYGSSNLRQAIRLIKKLRDAQGMDHIASYYIKTLVYWEIERQNNIAFWNQNPAVLFKLLVEKFYEAMEAGSIPFYWNNRNNLIGRVSPTQLAGYARKLRNLMVVLDTPSDYKKVAKFLLTPEEFLEYNTRFLQI